MQVAALKGKVFGKLTVVDIDRTEGGLSYWLCSCACGGSRVVRNGNLTSGNTKSCGCTKRNPRKHGLLHRPEYRTWSSMRTRCENPHSISYNRYGGRGIQVCERWREFANFFSDMGPRPSAHHSIDRIDSDGDYEPRNCRWATRKEQSDNKARTNKLTVRGETKTLAEWASETGLTQYILWSRLRRGWAPANIVAVPRGQRPSKYYPNRKAPG